MKKIILGIILSSTFYNPIFAQKQKEPVVIPVLPVDSLTGLFTYTEVVPVNDIKKNDLFNRALTWANTYYKNPADVIREKDLNTGKIFIKARFRISNEPDKKGTVTQAGDVMYSLTFLFKDGRYKYEITKINWQQVSYYPAERWKDTTADSFNPVYLSYLKQSDETLKSIIADFKKKIAATPVTKSNDW